VTKFLPIIFVILWSSAFITTKPIVDNSDPFTALCFRFLIVSFGFFLFSFFSNSKILNKSKNFLHSIGTGILFHGFYLGGVFYSISIGLPTGIAALIVTLQPVLTNALAGPLLNEKITLNRWLGVILGFVGASLVIGFDIGKTLPTVGIISTFISLFAVTAATLWQKKISTNLSLPVSNMYQALGGCAFHLFIIFFLIERPFIDFTITFVIAMSHQILLVSFGAFTILMFLIKKNSASKTVSFFFLIPPTSALMAWMFLNENLDLVDIFGFIITTIGVYIATREKK
jgi:drug/metabolite transporter (DMT)-like permease